MRRFAPAGTLAVILMMHSAIALAQADRATTKNPDLPAKQTILTVELLTGKEGPALAAQEWSQAFERLGMSVRIRSQLADEKPEVKEKQLGFTRMVTVIGKLERNGRVVFPERSFTQSEASKLKEYLDELKTYGAQGAPNGKPLWGLSESQFAALYSALAARVQNDVNDLPLTEAVTRIGLPEKYPFRMTTAAKDWLASEFPTLPNVRHHVRGMGLGTSLAIVLNGYGLGFRPLRTPAGTLELVVDPLKQVKDVWPIGWDLKETRQKTAPKLFDYVQVDLQDQKLADVLNAVAKESGIPVHVDHYRLEAKGIEAAELAVSYPSRKTTWSLLLKGVTNPHKLTHRLKIDELGNPFIWVTILDPGKKDE